MGRLVCWRCAGRSRDTAVVVMVVVVATVALLVWKRLGSRTLQVFVVVETAIGLAFLAPTALNGAILGLEAVGLFLIGMVTTARFFSVGAKSRKGGHTEFSFLIVRTAVVAMLVLIATVVRVIVAVAVVVVTVVVVTVDFLSAIVTIRALIARTSRSVVAKLIASFLWRMGSASPMERTLLLLLL